MVASSKQLAELRPTRGGARCPSRRVDEHQADVPALARLPACGPPPSLGENRDAAPLTRALTFVEEHLAEDISVDALARSAGLSCGRFAALFRVTVGESPYRYVLRLRVERARALLVQGASPTEAALAAGFYDQSHLTRHMQRLLGVTPGTLARTNRAS